MDTKLPERLKELRAEAGLSYAKLGKELGVAANTVFQWETNLTDITGKNLVLLARYFKVSTDYLLGLED